MKASAMFGKLLTKLGIGEKEQKILFNVFKYSLFSALLVSLCIWLIRYVNIQKNKPKQTVEILDPTIVYEKNSKDLLPVDVEAHLFTANYYIKNDQAQKAIDHILRVIPLQRTNRELKLELATAYLSSADYQKAYACFTQLIEAGSDSIDNISRTVSARMGLTLFYLGRVQASMDTLDSCIKGAPRSAEALCYRGEVEAAVSSSFQKSQDYFDRAIKLDSNYVEAWYQLARLCMNQGDYGRARICLLRVLEIEPLHVKTHSRLGMVYYYLEQPDMAKKSYLTALALNPGDYNTHYNLGELYYSKFNDSKHALDEFKKALQGNPAHIEANFKIGLICLSNNMTKEAITFFETARSQDPKNIRILLQLAVSYEKISMKEEAKGVYKYILDIDPLNKVAQQKEKLIDSSE